ncbi:MAG: TlpA family protein disulfide reductase [Candidatus Scalindua sp.]|nr:TlpA family protein disulfide reductase [Candidatus Scalindua sp.]
METRIAMRKLYVVSLCIVTINLFNLCHGEYIVCAGTETGINVGQKAPNFTLPNVDGSEFELEAFSKDKNVLLVFSATWCQACRHEIPLIKNFYNEFRDEGLGIVVIDIGESRSKVKSFVKEREINYNVILDEMADVAKIFKVTAIPLNIVLDKRGIIIYKDNAPPDKDFIQGLFVN